MRVKNVILGIKSLEEMLDEAKGVMKSLEKGEKVRKKKPGIYFKDLETMRKAITEEKLKILRLIKERHPGSVYELAKLLKRDAKNVANDVNYLQDLGLIELRKNKEGRSKNIPLVNYDKILVEIPV